MGRLIRKRKSLLVALLTSIILLLNQACVSEQKRIVTTVMLTKGDSRVAVGDFDEIGEENKFALAAYSAGDSATAYKLWKPLAEKGNAGAQNNLGHLYLGGSEDVPPRYS